MPYASAASSGPGAPAAKTQVAAGAGTRCTECGGSFPADELIPIGGGLVCAACKPVAVQKLKEGVEITGDYHYGGFWIRFAAKFVDGLILYAVAFVAQKIMAMVIAPGLPGHPNPALIFGGVGIGLGIRAFYNIWFIGKLGATPGKMACGLRVICSDGEKVSYARATGRFFAEILSGMIFAIGYIMAAFDEQKRALHDRICDTRVIYK